MSNSPEEEEDHCRRGLEESQVEAERRRRRKPRSRTSTIVRGSGRSAEYLPPASLEVLIASLAAQAMVALGLLPSPWPTGSSGCPTRRSTLMLSRNAGGEDERQPHRAGVRGGSKTPFTGSAWPTSRWGNPRPAGISLRRPSLPSSDHLAARRPFWARGPLAEPELAHFTRQPAASDRGEIARGPRRRRWGSSPFLWTCLR